MLTREVLGQRIAETRKKVGFSQEQLAVAIGLERTAITRIEKGQQGLDTLQLSAIAEALGCSPLVFLTESSEQPIEVLLRAPDAEREDVRSYLRWIDEFVRDYEFLHDLAKAPVA